MSPALNVYSVSRRLGGRGVPGRLGVEEAIGMERGCGVSSSSATTRVPLAMRASGRDEVAPRSPAESGGDFSRPEKNKNKSESTLLAHKGNAVPFGRRTPQKPDTHAYPSPFTPWTAVR